MKITEIEYGEVKSKDYNNFSLKYKIKLDEGENPEIAHKELVEKVRHDLAQSVESGSWEFQQYTQRLKILNDEIEIQTKKYKKLCNMIAEIDGLKGFQKKAKNKNDE